MTQNEGGRINVSSDGMGQGGIIIAPERHGPLHPINQDKCFKCPQYGQKIIYPRKCYYAKQCVLPVWFQKWRLNRILRKMIKDAKDTSLFMMAEGCERCPEDKHEWRSIVEQPDYSLSICSNCGKIKEEFGRKVNVPAYGEYPEMTIFQHGTMTLVYPSSLEKIIPIEDEVE